jgi:hypothetical protein
MAYSSTRRTACVEVDVDFDLDNFDEQDLIDYLEGKGYTIVEGKVNTKFENFEDIDKRIWQLYLIYKSDQGAGDAMDKALGTFFGEYYNKVSV